MLNKVVINRVVEVEVVKFLAGFVCLVFLLFIIII